MRVIHFNGRDFEVPEGRIAIDTAAIHADEPNLNGDLIPYSELEKAAPQYIGCQNVYIDHVTPEEELGWGMTVQRDVESRGEVLDAYCDPEDRCLYLLISIDSSFAELGDAILSASMNAVSFGADADIECPICGKSDCRHIDMRGTDGNYDILKNLEFREISIVFDPADPLALFRQAVEGSGE